MELDFFAHSEILAPFFFLIGMQLRNETTHIKEILLPSFAALGGMILPALIFVLVSQDPDIKTGWPLVMPTDIALVILVLLALGNNASKELKTFLLALAVADDLLSIVVIGFKYSGVLKISEVLASIGAVLLGVLIGRVPFEKAFVQVVNFLILPIYVFANVYPTIKEGFEFESSLGNSIILARVIGKILGITALALLGQRLFKTKLKISKRELIAGSALAGMGLAVSIMIANLSFAQDFLLNQAKSGLLLAAVLSALIGSFILIFGKNPKQAGAK
jgi:NhaA family Na+:H+ antiporter